MLRRIRFVAEACEVARPVSLTVVALAIGAFAMTSFGWGGRSVALGVMIAGLASVLVSMVRRAVADLSTRSWLAQQAAAEAERHYAEVLRRIIAFVEGRDPHLRGHSENVGRLAGRMAYEMGLPPEDCAELVLAGQLHDIGLLAVPEAVMASHARFGTEELRSVQKHPQASYEVLKPLAMLAHVLPAIRYHHERINGTGYPAGLAGQEVPLRARILAVADAYDAMTHDRPHRPAMTPLMAMRELRRCTPSGYDPECVEALGAIVNIPVLEEAAAGRPAV